ncbi:MAG TPA: carbohydrate ABC transporter permease [Trebonia sp.]|jgi:multiple sugar transport system permease protein
MRRLTARTLRLVPSRLVLLLFLIFALLPFLWMLTASLEPISSLYRASASLIPHPFTLQNYLDVLRPSSANSNDFVRQFINSIIVAGGTVVLAIVVGVPAAYGFSRFQFRGRRTIMYVILAQSIFPLVNFLVPLYILMQTIGLLNTYWSLIIGYLTFSLPLDIWMLKGFFDGIPTDMEISARLDGASRWRAFIEIGVPPAVPGIVATAVFTFILAWDEYLYALTMISSAPMRTLPLGIFSFFSDASPNWSLLTATAIAMSVPVVIVFLFLQRYFISALTKGALKY